MIDRGVAGGGRRPVAAPMADDGGCSLTPRPSSLGPPTLRFPISFFLFLN